MSIKNLWNNLRVKHRKDILIYVNESFFKSADCDTRFENLQFDIQNGIKREIKRRVLHG